MKYLTLTALIALLAAPVHAAGIRLTDDMPARMMVISKPGSILRVMVQPTPMTMKVCKDGIPDHAKDIAGEEFTHLVCVPADLTGTATILDDLPIADVE